MPQPRLRIGLAANRAHQDRPDSALVLLLRESRAAIQSHDLLPGYRAIERFPYGREGGLMKLLSRVVVPDADYASCSSDEGGVERWLTLMAMRAKRV